MVSSSSSSPLDPSLAQQQADCQGVQTSPDSTSHGTEQVSQGVQTSPDSTGHDTEQVSQGVQTSSRFYWS